MRYIIARNGSVAVWYLTIGEHETADEALSRMKACRGVLWKWDGITQIAITDQQAGNSLD